MKQFLPTLTLIATAAFVLSPYVTDPFSGFDPQRFPVPQTDPPVQPAGYAFAIWGVIYLWLAVSAITGVYARRQDPAWHRVQAPLILSLGPGAFWLWIAGFSPIGATALIFWMLFFAIRAFLRAPRRDRWVLQAPVGLYAGWLTAAAHVSLGVALGGYGLVSPQWAAIIALAGATALAIWVLASRPDSPEYGVAVIWALVGVLVANSGGTTQIITVTWIALLLVVLAAIRNLWAGQNRTAL
ncbi:hypothetical protein [Roseinatronobacter alkalisoli]|uniref:Tryptophan-rich sensory protein n=1 Tax=Roseinatronobacter alkalisoli TaxID=3028235 RepID=A0ABT5T3K1_9RHOB|nr:hypothetical protein [Roseinatronobacter sp. HJB301]MDD7969702.1 hypothetical protein [Roseinatronobacter sp. HJB301]